MSEELPRFVMCICTGQCPGFEKLDLWDLINLYLGIPRQMIPWFPTIDPEECVGCRECMNFCHDTVYAYDEDTHKVYVQNPWHCQVYCQSCTHACNKDAITFPDRREMKATIRELRAKYPPA